ncbi:hypothetical protein N7474_006761 [Penicillium riverlandense]|uniref:uncharacterized protein n=1 Tax=Penicillium riverlandense TaxID=1903569 RepID=UPI0025465DA4|nr:uncharacterized protein N7474_006761 [Penicillium riverlandense]KAJ5814984.1 hypothetical protein N7474_006761 [Penicillium riverlandense]
MISPSCPFCTIASSTPPISPTTGAAEPTQPSTTSPDTAPTAHLILSTEHVLAFLDIMPLTRGHVLVTPRRHYEMLGDVGVAVGQEMGKWLPILSRVVTRTVLGEDAEKHWNVVQNNGARAAQQVPHVHFHIIPRPAAEGAWNPRLKPSFAMFGRGQRDDLDDDEGASLASEMRAELAREVQRVFEEEGVDLGLDDTKQRGKL